MNGNVVQELKLTSKQLVSANNYRKRSSLPYVHWFQKKFYHTFTLVTKCTVNPGYWVQCQHTSVFCFTQSFFVLITGLAAFLKTHPTTFWESLKQNFYRPGAILTATSTKHCFYLTASFPVAALHFAQPTVPKDWYLVMYKSKWVFCDATNSTRQSTSISEVILQNVKDSCHLWEDEDFVSKWSQVCQQLINNDQLVAGRHQVFT